MVPSIMSIMSISVPQKFNNAKIFLFFLLATTFCSRIIWAQTTTIINDVSSVTTTPSPAGPTGITSSPPTSTSTSTTTGNNTGTGLQGFRFAIIPKSIGNPFFDPSGMGCKDQAMILGGKCLYIGPEGPVDDSTGEIQAQIIRELVTNQTVDGMAVSVRNIDITSKAINFAVESGIPVVTFDSDAPNSKRSAYVGTNNAFFGKQIAKVLKQLRPNGGTFGLLSSNDPNLQERQNGFLDELLTSDDNDDDDDDDDDSRKNTRSSVWTQIEHSPGIVDNGNTTLAMEIIQQFATNSNPTAIVPVMGLAMRSGTWEEFVVKNRHRNITLVSGDGMPNQLDLLSRRYVNGLVGQLPYEMGFFAVKVLHDILVSGGVGGDNQNPTDDDDVIVGTNVVTHIQVPLILPELHIDHNLIGNLVYVGYILFGIISFVAITLACWTFIHRNLHVVKVSQPGFLIMIAIGVLILACTIIPLSFDDSSGIYVTSNEQDGVNDDDDAQDNMKSAVAICMSIPWLAFTGFTIIFAALFSKTKRVNQLFHTNNNMAHGGGAHRRMRVTAMDVIRPFVVLLTMNFIVLICWTIIDPLTYTRQNNEGTDGWNRVISTYGMCQSQNVVYYLTPLAAINLSVLLLANWQAYEARSIESEFSESKYIGITMGSLLQAGLSGIPILFVVKDMPEAYYLVIIFMLFIVCMAVLLLIFIPKIVLKENYDKHNESEQKRLIARSIRTSAASTSQQAAVAAASAVARDGGPESYASEPLQNQYSSTFKSEASDVVQQYAAAAREASRNLHTNDQDHRPGQDVEDLLSTLIDKSTETTILSRDEASAAKILLGKLLQGISNNVERESSPASLFTATISNSDDGRVVTFSSQIDDVKEEEINADSDMKDVEVEEAGPSGEGSIKRMDMLGNTR